MKDSIPLDFLLSIDNFGLAQDSQLLEPAESPLRERDLDTRHLSFRVWLEIPGL
jgi:hypothetical protein